MENNKRRGRKSKQSTNLGQEQEQQQNEESIEKETQLTPIINNSINSTSNEIQITPQISAELPAGISPSPILYDKNKSITTSTTEISPFSKNFISAQRDQQQQQPENEEIEFVQKEKKSIYWFHSNE